MKITFFAFYFALAVICFSGCKSNTKEASKSETEKVELEEENTSDEYEYEYEEIEEEEEESPVLHEDEL